MIKAIIFMAFSIAYWYAFAHFGGALADGDPARKPALMLALAIYFLIVAIIGIYSLKNEPL